MALGTNTSFNSGPLVFLSPRSTDAQGNDIKPYFSVARVGADGKIAQSNEDPSDFVSGDLIRIEIKDKVVKGDTKRDIVLYIRDNTPITPENPGPRETYRLSTTFTMASRGLINSLASLTEKRDFTDISINYYRNKAGFDTYAVKKGGNKVSWKHELASLPKPEPILHPKTGKVLQNDYTAINEVFEREINAIIAVLTNGKGNTQRADSSSTATPPATTSKPPTTSKPTPTPEPPPAENLDEDVPF